MDFDALAKKSRQLAYEGQDYESILKNIPIESLGATEQKELRSLTNDFIVQYNLESQVKNKYKTQIMLGGVAAFLGLFILLFTYLRNESNFGIGLGVLLIGLYITKKSYDRYKQPIEFQDIAPKKESKFHRY